MRYNWPISGLSMCLPPVFVFPLDIRAAIYCSLQRQNFITAANGKQSDFNPSHQNKEYWSLTHLYVEFYFEKLPFFTCFGLSLSIYVEKKRLGVTSALLLHPAHTHSHDPQPAASIFTTFGQNQIGLESFFFFSSPHQMSSSQDNCWTYSQHVKS